MLCWKTRPPVSFGPFFGTKRWIILEQNKIPKIANNVLEKRPLRESVPNLKTKALAVRKCENEQTETASFMYNFVCVQLCTENQCNEATLMAFYTNFAIGFSHGFHQTIRFKRNFVSRLYPTPLPRPISIQYSVTWRPTSSLSPCDTTIHLFAQGPISVFVSRYTWYECAAGREKQSQNLIEKTYLEHAVLQLWLVRARVSTCQGPLRENEHC